MDTSRALQSVYRLPIPLTRPLSMAVLIPSKWTRRVRKYARRGLYANASITASIALLTVTVVAFNVVTEIITQALGWERTSSFARMSYSLVEFGVGLAILVVILGALDLRKAMVDRINQRRTTHPKNCSTCRAVADVSSPPMMEVTVMVGEHNLQEIAQLAAHALRRST